MAYVSEDNRALLRKQHWEVPLQRVWDTALVLAKEMQVEEIDSLAFRRWIVDNDDNDAKILEPGKWDIGTDFPEMGVTEYNYESGTIDGNAAMFKVDAKRLYYSDGLLQVKDIQRRVLRKWAKKIEKDVFNDLTNSRATAKGTQFNSALTQATGGIATGTQKHFIFQTSSGYAWNKEGDALQQIREFNTSITAADRLASLGGDVEFDPMTSVMYMDPLTWAALHDQLRDNDVTAKTVGTNAVTVDSLYGLTFAVANNAISTNGEAVIIDRAADAYTYKQSLPPLPEFARVAFNGSVAGGEKDKMQQDEAVSKLSLLIKDVDDDVGNVAVYMAHLGKADLRKPKSVAFWHGLYA